MNCSWLGSICSIRDRPYLHDPARRPALRDRDRFSFVGDLDDREAADGLLRLDERAVAHDGEILLAYAPVAHGLGAAAEARALDDLPSARGLRDSLADIRAPGLPPDCA